MHAHEKILDRKTYAFAALAVISFSHGVVTWFGRTMPGVVVDFFRGVMECIMLAATFTFIMAWLLRARPHDVPKSYHVVPFDVFGQPAVLRLDPLLFSKPAHTAFQASFRQVARSASHNNL